MCNVMYIHTYIFYVYPFFVYKYFLCVSTFLKIFSICLYMYKMNIIMYVCSCIFIYVKQEDMYFAADVIKLSFTFKC